MTKALCLIAAVFTLTADAQENTKPALLPMEQGPYQPTWESLAQYEVPEWFRDAKFGIWAHWGPQCEPEAGDWYARHMYYPGHWQYEFHVKKYGDPAKFGFKDVIHEWRAEKWDPEYLIKLYKDVGARYFVTLANHHDNFDLWDSDYQPWNSVNMGPEQNIVGRWAEMCDKYGLRFGVSVHASHTWTWMEGAQDFDGKLTAADGKGTWWEGYDPQDLYEQRHTRSVGSENVGTIHSQWEWGNGASQPDKAYLDKFYNRTVDVINKYDPDVVYFDDTALPFSQISDEGLKIAAHLYNKSLRDHRNRMQAVIMGKKLTEQQKQAMLWDVERGIPDRMQELPWQTCTCLGEWHYNRDLYNRNGYKSAETVIRMLIDIVSKNGNLLLSVPLRGDGSIDEKELAVLEGIKAWMDVNSESIYGTRPWRTFGEGPSADAANPINNQGFNEGNTAYSAADIRFVQKGNTLYATALGWPENGRIEIRSLADGSDLCPEKIRSVRLLGYGKIAFERDAEALKVTLPADFGRSIAPVLAVTLK